MVLQLAPRSPRRRRTWAASDPDAPRHPDRHQGPGARPHRRGPPPARRPGRSPPRQGRRRGGAGRRRRHPRAHRPRPAPRRRRDAVVMGSLAFDGAGPAARMAWVQAQQRRPGPMAGALAVGVDLGRDAGPRRPGRGWRGPAPGGGADRRRRRPRGRARPDARRSSPRSAPPADRERLAGVGVSAPGPLDATAARSCTSRPCPAWTASRCATPSPPSSACRWRSRTTASPRPSASGGSAPGAASATSSTSPSAPAWAAAWWRTAARCRTAGDGRACRAHARVDGRAAVRLRHGRLPGGAGVRDRARRPRAGGGPRRAVGGAGEGRRPGGDRGPARRRAGAPGRPDLPRPPARGGRLARGGLHLAPPPLQPGGPGHGRRGRQRLRPHGGGRSGRSSGATPWSRSGRCRWSGPPWARTPGWWAPPRWRWRRAAPPGSDAQRRLRPDRPFRLHLSGNTAWVLREQIGLRSISGPIGDADLFPGRSDAGGRLCVAAKCSPPRRSA